MPAPLADRIRPRTLDEVVGQRHILGPDRALRRIIQAGEVPNMVFYGPSGVGKTTVCQMLKRRLPRAAFLDGDWCWDMGPPIR